jgi:hypothetical protein
MRAREEFQPINTRASLIVNNFGGRRALRGVVKALAWSDRRREG